MKRINFLAIFTLLLPIFISGKGQIKSNLVQFVNPLIGTQSTRELSNGNTAPLIARPWGMNFWMPQTAFTGDNWSYNYNHNRICGFKQTHQPSPWIGDYGTFSIMPITGKRVFAENERQSWFSHKAEIVKPYYYKVYLADFDVITEFTTTDRAALFQFTFPSSDSSWVIIDALDQNSYVKIIPEQNKIIGYSTRNSGGVPSNFKNYFVIVFSKKIAESVIFADKKQIDGLETSAFHAGAMVRFSTSRQEKIHARVASSFISFEQAELNLKELGTTDFDALVAEGEQVWNEKLNTINIEGATQAQNETFYSCLYRSMLFPRKSYEINENDSIVHYSPYTGKILPGYMFTDAGFWDTFRSLNPLLNLLFPTISQNIQEGLVNVYTESGFYPEWASPGHRDCMIGNNSASILADAYLKNIKVSNPDLMYKGILHGANNSHPTISSTGRKGVAYYNKLGYIPYNVGINENVARTLEYAYNDWCIYQLGKKLNRPENEIGIYAERALNYKNVFDSTTNLMRGRNLDGSFQSPFNPLKWGDAFTEGNSWHYSWSVFHDVQGLVKLMGGSAKFQTMLDSVFLIPPLFDESYYGQVIHEIREMQISDMGNYAHGNQPIQHAVYLYNYIGQPWKAQHKVREILDKLYTNKPDGYCGDEDNGQTSAWYVFSALGFYPVCPGSNEYVLGAPLFKKATITLDNGKKIVLNAPKNSSENIYIRSMLFNGKPHTKNFLNHNDLIKGAKIKFNMQNTPATKRGIDSTSFPYSFSVNNQK